MAVECSEIFIMAKVFVTPTVSYVTPRGAMTHSLRSHGLDKLPSRGLLALGCFDTSTEYLPNEGPTFQLTEVTLLPILLAISPV